LVVDIVEEDIEVAVIDHFRFRFHSWVVVELEEGVVIDHYHYHLQVVVVEWEEEVVELVVAFVVVGAIDQE
jgi:hypothetical protein